MSGVERQLTFEKDNIGFVRFKDAARGIFYLDPFWYLDTWKNEIYICTKKPYPPKNKLVEVVVRETEEYKLTRSMEVTKTIVKYVIDWHTVDPNKLKINKLLNPEEFTSILTYPIKRCYSREDLGYCLGLYMVSSPQLTDFEPGGINTVMLGKYFLQQKWGVFTRISGIIPKEFKRTTSRNYYKLLETPEQPCPVNSVEVNRAYFNIDLVPVHIPLPFDVEFVSYAAQQEELRYALPYARAYMLDALMFQPEISDKYMKLFEEAMHEILQETKLITGIAYCQDFGDLIPKLSTSFARLQFHQNVSKDDINVSLDAWLNMISISTRSKKAAKIYENFHCKSPEEKIILGELINMEDTGIELTLENLRARSVIPELQLEKSLQELRMKGYIYTPGLGRIGLVNKK